MLQYRQQLSLADIALSQKLQEELNFETQDADQKGVPEFLQQFKAQGVWTVSSFSIIGILSIWSIDSRHTIS